MHICTLVVFLLLGSFVLSNESKVTIDSFTAEQSRSFTFPEDCEAQTFVTDSTILGGGRSMEFFEWAIANNFYVTCTSQSSCSLSSQIANGIWSVSPSSDSVSGNCQISVTYAGNFVDYVLLGGAGFQLSTNGATSFRVVVEVTGAPVVLFINSGRQSLASQEVPVGSNDLVLPFVFTDQYQYYDFVDEITLGVRFTDARSTVRVTTFETYGPASSDAPLSVPAPASLSGLTRQFVVDDFSIDFEGSGSIVDSIGCGGTTQTQSSFTDDIGSRGITVQACRAEGGDLSFLVANGVLTTSIDKGLAANFALSYQSISTSLDFCQGDGLLVSYSAVDDVECRVYVITDDDDGVCETTILFKPDAQSRFLPLRSFDTQDCDRSSIKSMSFQCDLYGDSQSMQWNSIEYACSSSTCTCGNVSPMSPVSTQIAVSPSSSSEALPTMESLPDGDEDDAASIASMSVLVLVGSLFCFFL